MKSLSKMLSVAALVPVLALGLVPSGPAAAQAQAQAQAPAPTGRPIASPAAIATAAEILQMKNVREMYSSLIVSVVQRTRDALLRGNLNYQKDLNEVAPIIAQQLADREKELADALAKIYAAEFTEQELKDLLTFYKSPLGQKMLVAEPKTIQVSSVFMHDWAIKFADVVNGAFRAEMRKRGKEI